MSIFSKLKQALNKTSNKISGSIDHIFFKKKLDDQTLEELEDLLIAADISQGLAASITSDLRKLKFGKEVSPEEIKLSLAELIIEILNRYTKPFELNKNELNIVLISGVNGNGKTTTIGKLAAYFIAQGNKVGIAACDTFRAAALEQLEVWAQNSKAVFFTGDNKQDPASVAYNACVQAKEQKLDILFIDTAGRLHNQKNLMDELAKIVKVIKKLDSNAPAHSLLVIDATTGQNAYNQVEQFGKVAGVDGLIVTKLDGTAKAGVTVGIVQKFTLPVYFIGIGEKIDDLKEFNSEAFAKALVNI